MDGNPGGGQPVDVADQAPPDPPARSPDWLARVGWAVLVAALVLAGLAATVGWNTTSSATVDLCRESAMADGQSLYRPSVVVPGRTIPSSEAASMPDSALAYGWRRLPSGAVVVPNSQEYPQLPAGHRVEVHHRLFRSSTYTFLADDGTKVALDRPPDRKFDRVACTGS